jgi:hypothetical protein
MQAMYHTLLSFLSSNSAQTYISMKQNFIYWKVPGAKVVEVDQAVEHDAMAVDSLLFGIRQSDVKVCRPFLTSPLDPRD